MDTFNEVSLVRLRTRHRMFRVNGIDVCRLGRKVDSCVLLAGGNYLQGGHQKVNRHIPLSKV
jgi:hypothetical protein